MVQLIIFVDDDFLEDLETAESSDPTLFVFHVAGTSYRASASDIGHCEVDIGQVPDVGSIDLIVNNRSIFIGEEASENLRQGGFFTLGGTEDPTLRLVSPEIVATRFARNITEQLHVSSYRGRLTPTMASAIPRPAIATTPSSDSALPTNGVATRRVANYLTPNNELAVEDSSTLGVLYEMESSWEPLGWALDEWISTVSLAPDQDVAGSEISIGSDSSLRATDNLRENAKSAARRQSDEDINETSVAAISQSGDSSGFNAGVGRQQASGLSLTINPLSALTQAVTGAVQLGYSTANVDAASNTEAEVRRQVANVIEEQAAVERTRNANDVVAAAGGYLETRRLTAHRNTANRTTLNLALFTVVRQWLVTTIQSRAREVVFCPVHDVNKPFTSEDLFLHHGVLRSVLNDPSLIAVLDRAAADYDPDEPEVTVANQGRRPGIDAVVRSVHFTARVDNRAEGRGSQLRFGVRFAGTIPGAVKAIEANGTTTHNGQLIQCGIVVGLPMRDLLAWTFEFVNPGMRSDKTAAISDVKVTSSTTTEAYRQR